MYDVRYCSVCDTVIVGTVGDFFGMFVSRPRNVQIYMYMYMH